MKTSAVAVEVGSKLIRIARVHQWLASGVIYAVYECRIVILLPAFLVSRYTRISHSSHCILPHNTGEGRVRSNGSLMSREKGEVSPLVDERIVYTIKFRVFGLWI